MRSAFAVVLGLVTASEGIAQQPATDVAARSPEQAAGQALMACVAHAMGMAPITAGNAQALAKQGLVYSEAYPSYLRARAQNEFGSGSFARVPSTDGQVWATGYDSGVCIFSAIGTPDGPIVQQLEQMFAIPGGWKPTKVNQLPGASWSAYEWKSPRAHLSAQVSVTNLPPDSPAKGFVSVTIAPKSKAKK